MKETAIIIQARMSSTRLPSKILMQAAGKPFLQYQLERLGKTGIPVIIASTTNPADQQIAQFCIERSIDFFLGDEQNVLSRYFECAQKFDVKNIIRITSDCPLIDPDAIIKGVEVFNKLKDSWAYVSNTIERTYPRGFDFEIFSFEALSDAVTHATLHEDKEHVTPYLWKNKSDRIQIHQIKRNGDASHYRLTLDTKEDFQLLKKLIEDFKAAELSGEEIINVMATNPELEKINSHIEQKEIGH